MFEILDSGYIPIAAEKAHARIIWDCGWAIEGDIFATASRDKTVFNHSCYSSSNILLLCMIQVKIWNQDGGKWKAVTTLTTEHPATAVAFTSLKKTNRFVSCIRTKLTTSHFVVGDILPLDLRVEKS